MKSLTCETSRSFVQKEKPMPVPQKGQVVIKVACAAICGSDHLLWLAGVPCTPGHEFSGWVEDPGDSGFKKGDRVCAPEINPCGECEFCLSGQENLCVRGLTGVPGVSADGAYGEYVAVRADLLRRLPDDMPMELGAIAEPAAVSLHGLRRSGMPVGETLLVWGNGPIGIYAAALAKLEGAKAVYMVGRNPGRVDFCNALDFVDGCFSVKDAELDKKLAEAAPGGFGYAVDALGRTDAFDQLLSHMRVRGTIALLGLHSQTVEFNTAALLAKEVSLVPGWFFTLKEYDDALALIEANREMFMRTISRRIPADAETVQEKWWPSSPPTRPAM